MTLTLPDLPYAHDALNPYMSTETLEFHHDKHHNAYVTKANELLEGNDLQGKSIEEIVRGSHSVNNALFNNAAQHYNHLHFWQWMKPGGGGSIPSALENQIKQDLGSTDSFRSAFVAAGMGQFGSGWCWLVMKGGRLDIMATPNGENPLVHDATPLLGCDVWEHSYYIDHRNNRKAYLEAFLDNLVNWEYVSELYDGAS